MIDDIRSFIGRHAPLVGTLVGQPAIGALIANALGVENDQQSIANAIKSDPEAAFKLKQMELDNISYLKKLSQEITLEEIKDKQDARLRHKQSNVPSVICAVLTLAVITLGVLVFFFEVKEENKEIAYWLFGAIMAKWGDSVAYWVGISRTQETEMIHKNIAKHKSML